MFPSSLSFSTKPLEVYVPLRRAYRRKHPVLIPAPKITPNVLGNLNMTTSPSQAENCLPRYNMVHERILEFF